MISCASLSWEMVLTTDTVSSKFTVSIYVRLRTFWTPLVCVCQGERLSHAVGCAFTICLERKQQRDREKAALVGGQCCTRPTTATQRTGSFRQTSLAERLTDPQSAIVAGYHHSSSSTPWAFPFEHNFCNYCLILISLSLLQTDIICPQTRYRISHFTYSLLLHYVEKCNRMHFFTETVEQICNACGNFIVVT